MTKINIIALGGLDEKYKNLYTIEINSKIYIIDSGIYEPLKNDFGIQHFIPRLDYLEDNKDKIKAAFLSTPNIMQVGSIIQVVEKLPNIKIYGSDVTIELLKLKFNESKNWNMQSLIPYEDIEVAGVTVKPVTMPASIPGTLGFIFKTSAGNIVYLTDHIFDSVDEYRSPLRKTLETLSQEKTLLLMSDSLNANIEQSISPNYRISKLIEPVFKQEERIIVIVYEEDFINIVELLTGSEKANKKVYFLDKNLYKLVIFMMSKGYIEQSNVEFYNPEIKNANSVVIISGNITTLFKNVLALIASESENTIIFKKKDWVIFASVPQAGNEHVYADVTNEIARVEPNILLANGKEKTSFHPSQFDIKNYLNFIEPKYFMPIKGYFKELDKSKRVAILSGMNKDNIIVAFNGDVISFENENYIGITRKIKEVGDQVITDIQDRGIETEVILSRTALAQHGLVAVSVLVNKQKEISSNIDIQMRGVIFIKNQDRLMTDIRKTLLEIVDKHKEKWNEKSLKQNLEKEVLKIIRTATKKTPQVVAKIIEV